MDAPYFYIVKFWVHPDGLKPVLDWLDRGHMADDGWSAYMMIYGLQSQAALQRYVDGPAPSKFAQERKPFEHHLRMERVFGAIDAAIP
jgi:hypothetical protein